MNKQGKTSPWVYVILTLFAVLAILFFTGNIGQKAVGTGAQPSTGTNCGITTTINPTISDLLSPNTAVSASFSGMVKNPSSSVYGSNQTVTSSTSLPYLGSVKLLGTASGYLNTIFDPQSLSNCGPNYFQGGMYAYSAPSVTILKSPSNVAVTNSSTGGASNFSTVATGGTLQFGIQLVGSDKKTSGDMLVLIEANTSVSSITLNGVVGKIAKPSTYSTHVSTNSQVFEFDFPAQNNAYNTVLNGVVTMKSSQTYSASPLWITVEGKQAFLDSTGQYTTGVETSDGLTAEQAYTVVAVGYIA